MGIRRLAWLCWIAGCAHGAGTPEPAPPAAEPAPEATGGEPTPVSGDGPRAGVEPYMAAHFAIATTARDWVIDGNLTALREPLFEFSSQEYEEAEVGGWLEGIGRMQHAARLTAEAHTLDLAAMGVATMARACGECHQEQGRGPHFLAPGPDAYEASGPGEFSGRMVQHMWAADRMWEGVTGPSEASWKAGATALAQTPLQPPRMDPPLPEGFVAALGELRQLGQQATEAETLSARADVYGLLLASCSACHAFLGHGREPD